MRLYTLSKRHFVLVFVLFLICFALTVFIGIAGMDDNVWTILAHVGRWSEIISVQIAGLKIEQVIPASFHQI